jgi:peroxiredoxin
MKKIIALLASATVCLSALAAEHADKHDKGMDGVAPGFTLKDLDGNEHSLSDFKGKIVVLEWTNFGCPFVKKHYGPGNMQALQEKYTGKGVVWLTVCSSAPGKQGYFKMEDWPAKAAEMKMAATAVLPDPDGKVGKLYGAKTTPHMFVIDEDGGIAYQGAIDDNRSWDPKTIKGATNYVAEALDALLAGEEVKTAKTNPYGCSVKY